MANRSDSQEGLLGPPATWGPGPGEAQLTATSVMTAACVRGQDGMGCPCSVGRAGPGLHQAPVLTWLCQDLGEGAAGGLSWAPWNQLKSGSSFGLMNGPGRACPLTPGRTGRKKGPLKAPRQLFP